MGNMNYQQAWKFLDQLQFFKIKLGLDSMNRFLDRLDNPHHNLPCIHIVKGWYEAIATVFLAYARRTDKSLVLSSQPGLCNQHIHRLLLRCYITYIVTHLWVSAVIVAVMDGNFFS